jgi:hypothetical protein
VHLVAATGAALSVSSATIGGVAATIQAQASDDPASDVLALMTAPVPAGTTGTISVTASRGCVRAGLGVWAMTGAASETPYDIRTASNSDPLTVALDVPASGAVVGVSGFGNASSAATWTNLSEDFDTAMESGYSISGAHQAFSAAQTDLSITADPASASVTTLIAASWQPT